MRILLPFLFILAALSSQAQALQPNGCPDYEPPVVIVNQLAAQPKLDMTYDLAGIKRLALEGKKDFSSTEHETPVGLTAASLKLDTHYEINVRKNPDDPLICAQIKSFSVDYGFEDTTIYLARELPQNSCSLQTVLEHEERHVNIDYKLIASTKNYLQDQIRQALAQIGTIRASTGDVAERQIQTAVKQYMKDLGHNISLVRQKQQAAIDTPEEYDRLSRACDGALADLIRGNGGR